MLVWGLDIIGSGTDYIIRTIEIFRLLKRYCLVKHLSMVRMRVVFVRLLSHPLFTLKGWVAYIKYHQHVYTIIAFDRSLLCSGTDSILTAVTYNVGSLFSSFSPFNEI